MRGVSQVLGTSGERSPKAVLAGRWFKAVTRGKVCIVTGKPGSAADPLQAHHVISKQRLRRLFQERGQKTPLDMLYHVDNGVPVLYSVHRRHTAKLETIPRGLLPPEAWRFAEELGLLWWLEREYPT
jgi:hypothetical protein